MKKNKNQKRDLEKEFYQFEVDHIPEGQKEAVRQFRKEMDEQNSRAEFKRFEREYKKIEMNKNKV